MTHSQPFFVFKSNLCQRLEHSFNKLYSCGSALGSDHIADLLGTNAIDEISDLACISVNVGDVDSGLAHLIGVGYNTVLLFVHVRQSLLPPHLLLF